MKPTDLLDTEGLTFHDIRLPSSGADYPENYPSVWYENREATFTTEAPTITPSLTWMGRYQLMFRGDDIVLFHRHQGFKDVGHGSATRVNADQGIRVTLIGNWHVQFEYDLRYNSLPVTGRKTTDTNIIFGISYDIKP